jgi:hypothetical protein
MHGLIVSKHGFKILLILTVIMFLLSSQVAQAAEYVIKAPVSSAFLKGDEYQIQHVVVQDWACRKRDSQGYADKVVGAIRDINLLVQPLEKARKLIEALEKALAQEKQQYARFTRYQLENMINDTIKGTVKKAGFESEKALVEKAEDLSKETMKKIAHRIDDLFGSSAGFKVTYGFFGYDYELWKLAGTDNNGADVVYVVQDCYQKKDMEAMAGAVESAARTLHDGATNFKNAKDKLLATGTDN